MTTAAPVLFEFLPVGDMLDVAEAVVRVFHERGDYQHRQRNRMKFLIKAMGWDGFRAAFEEALAQVRAEGGRELAFAVRARRPRSRHRRWTPAAAPSVAEIARRVATAAAAQHGPGIHPSPAPVGRRPPLRSLGCAPTCGRRSRRTTSAPWSRCRWAT